MAGRGAVTTATPGTRPSARAADSTGALPGMAGTSASTPGLASRPVARTSSCSARALDEPGLLNGFLALSSPMAVAPNTPDTMKATRASSSIRRG